MQHERAASAIPPENGWSHMGIVSLFLSPFSFCLVFVFVFDLSITCSFYLPFWYSCWPVEYVVLVLRPPQHCLPACKSRNYLSLPTFLSCLIVFLFVLFASACYLISLLFSLSPSICFSSCGLWVDIVGSPRFSVRLT